MQKEYFAKKIKNKSPLWFKKVVKYLYKSFRDLRIFYNSTLLSKSIAKNDIVRLLRNLGIKSGDTIFVHSSMSRLGKIDGGSQTILEALLEVVGNRGTVGAPTFWGFTRQYLSGELTFNVLESPSILGSLTERIRTHKYSKRSLHPTHSVSFIGPQANFLVKDHHRDITPFGKNSPYRRLIEIGGKILLIGVSIEYMTSLHTIEDSTPDFPVNVYLNEPYTFDVKDDTGKAIKVLTYIHNPEISKRRNSHLLEPYFDKLNLIKKDQLGYGIVRLIDAKKLHDTLYNLFIDGVTMYH